MDEGLGGCLARDGGGLAHLQASLFHRMIPKEQKGPAMAAVGDLSGPGKVDSALVRSSDSILSWYPSVDRACWPGAWANRCEVQASPEGALWNLPLGLGSFPKYWGGPCPDAHMPRG